MNALTIAELRRHHADLVWKAEKLREQWQILPPTAKAVQLGKEIKALQERAKDYAKILEGLERACESS